MASGQLKKFFPNLSINTDFYYDGIRVSIQSGRLLGSDFFKGWKCSKKRQFRKLGPDLEIQVQTNFKRDHPFFASSMKREIICLELEFRTSGCEIQRQQYSITENLIESTILKCRKPVIFRYDIMMTSSFI